MIKGDIDDFYGRGAGGGVRAETGVREEFKGNLHEFLRNERHNEQLVFAKK